LARRLKLDEQNVYYNLRRLEEKGLIKLLRTEERTGGTAKIYSLIQPVISVKIGEEAFLTNIKFRYKNLDLLRPFIENDKLNARIIFGDPYPHGKFDTGWLDGCYASDLTLFLGTFLRELNFPGFTLDIQVTKSELKDNLILIGSPRGNTITYKLNSQLPIYFDENNEWAMVSKITGKTYEDDFGGVVEIIRNPFNKDKKVLILAGRRTRGTMSAVLAFTKYHEEVMKGNIKDKKIIARIVHGYDSNGDGYVDDIKFVE